MRSFLSQILRPFQPTVADVELTCRSTGDGFAIERGDVEVQRIRWDDVQVITAYPAVGPVSDRIVVVFNLEDEPRRVEIEEDGPGWAEVIEAMLGAFPTIPRDWHFDARKVRLYPPWPSERTLFKRG